MIFFTIYLTNFILIIQNLLMLANRLAILIYFFYNQFIIDIKMMR